MQQLTPWVCCLCRSRLTEFAEDAHIYWLAYPADSVLAPGVAGIDPVAACVADLAAFPAGGHYVRGTLCIAAGDSIAPRPRPRLQTQDISIACSAQVTVTRYSHLCDNVRRQGLFNGHLLRWVGYPVDLHDEYSAALLHAQRRVGAQRVVKGGVAHTRCWSLTHRGVWMLDARP